MVPLLADLTLVYTVPSINVADINSVFPGTVSMSRLATRIVGSMGFTAMVPMMLLPLAVVNVMRLIPGL